MSSFTTYATEFGCYVAHKQIILYYIIIIIIITLLKRN